VVVARVSRIAAGFLVPLALAGWRLCTSDAGPYRTDQRNGSNRARCPGPEIASSPCPPGPVDGATVIATLRGRAIGSTRTDAHGDFRLTLPVGRYLIRATNVGGNRSTTTDTVTVTAGHASTITLLLDTGIR